MRRLRTTAGQLSGVLGDQGVWAKVISGLLEGSQGPTLPLVVISKLESELRALLQIPLLGIDIFGRLLLVREVNSNCIAQAGQCFLFHDGTFAQLIISTSSPTGDVLCMVSPFETVPHAPEKGRYMVFWWLQRCDHFSLVSVTFLAPPVALAGAEAPWRTSAPAAEDPSDSTAPAASGRPALGPCVPTRVPTVGPTPSAPLRVAASAFRPPVDVAAVLLVRAPSGRYVLAADADGRVPRPGPITSRGGAVAAAEALFGQLCAELAGKIAFLAADLPASERRARRVLVAVCPALLLDLPAVAAGWGWHPVAGTTAGPDAFLVGCAIAATQSFCPARLAPLMAKPALDLVKTAPTIPAFFE